MSLAFLLASFHLPPLRHRVTFHCRAKKRCVTAHHSTSLALAVSAPASVDPLPLPLMNMPRHYSQSSTTNKRSLFPTPTRDRPPPPPHPLPSLIFCVFHPRCSRSHRFQPPIALSSPPPPAVSRVLPRRAAEARRLVQPHQRLRSHSPAPPLLPPRLPLLTLFSSLSVASRFPRSPLP